MKFILERWDRFLTEEQEVIAPQTVGELLQAINDYTMLRGDPTKRVIKSVISVLDQLTGLEGIDAQSLFEIREILDCFLEDEPATAIAKLGIENIYEVLYNIFSKKAVQTFLVEKLGAEIFKTFVEEIIPGFKTFVKVSSFFSKLFTITKTLKTAIDSSKMTPKQVLTQMAQEIYSLPDSKETTSGFMGIFNVDDKWSAIIDDKIEMKFIERTIALLERLPANTPLTNINFNNMLVNYLKGNYENRTLAREPEAI
jgi:hypothetical protein